jgi:hypothetical protein
MQTAELIKNEVLSESDSVQLREVFVAKYCAYKGWDRYNLSFEQVFEIRTHNEWKSPGLMKS